MSALRVAAIDCGTNSVVLLVADQINGTEWHTVEERSEATRLGQGLGVSSELTQDAIQRTVTTVVSMYEQAKELGAQPILVVGTEALRAAHNATDFLHHLASHDISMRVLSSQEEASLAWQAALYALPNPATEWRSVVDLGAGSMQLTVGRGSHLHYWGGIAMGATRLGEGVLAHDPPTLAERTVLQEEAAHWVEKFSLCRGQILAVSGTWLALGALCHNIHPYDASLLHGRTLERVTLQQWVGRLARMPLSERQALPALPFGRAPWIYSGAVLALQFMNTFGLTSVTLCNSGIRLGMLQEHVLSLRSRRSS